jgi:hypothetical protein
MFHYEHKHEPLLPWRDFLLHRVATSLALGLGVILASLLAGILGYRIAGGMGWLDAFLNAAMILGGMGPGGRPARHRGQGFRRDLCPVQWACRDLCGWPAIRTVCTSDVASFSPGDRPRGGRIVTRRFARPRDGNTG